MTRAKHQLDNSGLAWVNDLLGRVCDKCGSGILNGEHIANYDCSQKENGGLK